MKMAHIIVANEVLDTIQGSIDWKISKRAYLFGSIAPDINCVYPAHTINATYNRFRKRLNRMDKSSSIMIKSFTLGVITHYICDYFCYAHNIYKLDTKHHVYEKIMKQHLAKHDGILTDTNSELYKQWNEMKQHIVESMYTSEDGESVSDKIGNISINGADHIKYILELTNTMHESYIEKTRSIDEARWYTSLEKMRNDVEYSAFMCKGIAMLLLNPSKELGCIV